jgi:hypothetical protein
MRVGKCCVCGKEFVFTGSNIFKRTVDGKVKRTCGWNCLRELEKEIEAKKKLKEVTVNEDR